MANPREKGMVAVKRHRPRTQSLYVWQSPTAEVLGYPEGDVAGDREARESGNGGAVFKGFQLIKSWAKMQIVVATSSAEAELYALGRVASESLGAQSLLRDLGSATTVSTYIDSSAALSLTQRTGLGKAKHIEVQHLWVQGAIKDGRLTCRKWPGEENPADIGTKALNPERIRYLMGLLGYRLDGMVV